MLSCSTYKFLFIVHILPFIYKLSRAMHSQYPSSLASLCPLFDSASNPGPLVPYDAMWWIPRKYFQLSLIVSGWNDLRLVWSPLRSFTGSVSRDSCWIVLWNSRQSKWRLSCPIWGWHFRGKFSKRIDCFYFLKLQLKL